MRDVEESVKNVRKRDANLYRPSSISLLDLMNDRVTQNIF